MQDVKKIRVLVGLNVDKATVEIINKSKLEQSFLESVSEAQKASGFNRAFSNNSYVAYSSENVYLNDNTSFIEKPEGSSNYLCTIRYNGNDYGKDGFGLAVLENNK